MPLVPVFEALGQLRWQLRSGSGVMVVGAYGPRWRSVHMITGVHSADIIVRASYQAAKD